MSAAELPSPPADFAPRFRVNWIAGPWTDLPWFIGGALGGYALFAMYAFALWPMETIWLVWYVLLDIPHFFGTYVRTYLDPVERERRPLLLYGSLGLVLVGPSLIGLGCLLWAWGPEWAATYHRLPFDLLFVFVMFWAYWHVVRQHYGIMALYKRKNDDSADCDGWVDSAMLYVGLMVPLLVVVLNHPETRAQVGLTDERLFWEFPVLTFAAVLVAMCAALFAGRQIYLWNSGEPVNLPKILFLLAVVPLHLFVAYHPATFETSLIGFGAFVTIFHDIQYHSIVWHAQQMKLHRPGADPSRHGLSAWVSSNFFLFMACGMAMGVGAWFVGCSLGIRPGCIPLIDLWHYPLFGNVWLWHAIMGVVLGGIMHHYFVDQFIWRPSEDEQVRRDLTEQAGGAESAMANPDAAMRSEASGEEKFLVGAATAEIAAKRESGG